MSEALFQIEVVYATADRQALITLDVPAGSSVQQALAACGIERQFPELVLAECVVGVFGKVVNEPATRLLKAGERIEIYRPLLADPMEVRRLRAARARLNRESGS
jgi:putative ubiquitin-RnfH superfamily antitoxin RatB of RatAB toxin-antitoxin module